MDTEPQSSQNGPWASLTPKALSANWEPLRRRADGEIDTRVISGPYFSPSSDHLVNSGPYGRLVIA